LQPQHQWMGNDDISRFLGCCKVYYHLNHGHYLLLEFIFIAIKSVNHIIKKQRCLEYVRVSVYLSDSWFISCFMFLLETPVFECQMNLGEGAQKLQSSRSWWQFLHHFQSAFYCFCYSYSPEEILLTSLLQVTRWPVLSQIFHRYWLSPYFWTVYNQCSPVTYHFLRASFLVYTYHNWCCNQDMKKETCAIRKKPSAKHQNIYIY